MADENGNFDELVENNEQRKDFVVPEILNIQVNGYSVKVDAKDSESGLAEKAYSLDGKNWQSSNEIKVTKAGKYTIYIRDNAGNIASKTVDVIATKEDKTQAKTIIPQTGATFPIVILIVVSVIGFVGYKKFKKVNY